MDVATVDVADLGEGGLVEATGVGVTVVGEGEGEEIEMMLKNGSQ